MGLENVLTDVKIIATQHTHIALKILQIFYKQVSALIAAMLSKYYYLHCLAHFIGYYRYSL